MMTNKLSTTLPWASVALLTTLLSACETEPTVNERNFGASVRQMIEAQLYDPEAARNPDPEPVTGLDGQQAAEVMAVHRADVAKPQEIRNDISINVGN